MHLVSFFKGAAYLTATVAILSSAAAVRANDSVEKANPAAQSNEDEAAIRASAKAYEKAFADADAKALAAMFAEDGELIDVTGRTFKGRDELEQDFAAIFADRPGAKVEVQIDSIKFLSPDVAIETGIAKGQSNSRPAGPPTKYTAVHAKRNGKWLLTNVNESHPATSNDSEQLADLSFLIGEWKADLGAGKVYQMRCEWMPEKSFLKRSFNVQENGKELSAGTQIIGYDPLADQIVSWTFDSSGGFGHEMWDDQGGRWRVTASSILPDGSTSLATNYLTKGDNNSFTWQSVERSLNDQLLPDTTVVRVERVSE